MKTILVSILVAILPSTAFADWNFVIGFGFQTTSIRIVNDTDDAYLTKAEVAGKQLRGLRTRTGYWQVRLNPAYYGDVPVIPYACPIASASATQGFSNPPAWTRDLSLGPEVALTDKFLNANPKVSAVKKRVKALTKSQHDRLAGKENVLQLEIWFHEVVEIGVKFPATTCGDPIALQAKSFAYGVVNGGNQPSRVIFYVVRGNRKDGYRVDGPITVNN